MRQIMILVLLAALLCGCSAVDNSDAVADVPAQNQRLTVFTCLEAQVYTPLVREFQERTGIYVEVRGGSAGELLENLEGCDVLLGWEADQLEADAEKLRTLDRELSGNVSSLCPQGESWVPVSIRAMVIVYNPKLVRQNPPADLESLLQSPWAGKIAFADPEANAFSRSVLQVLARGKTGPDPERLRRFAGNLNELLADTEDVIRSVADGSCCLGVVPEDAARLWVESGLDLTVVYPQSGVWMLTEGAAIPKDAPHPENARAFLTFLLGENAQSYGKTNLFRGSVLEKIVTFPENALIYDPVSAASDREVLMEQWQEIWEEEP